MINFKIVSLTESMNFRFIKVDKSWKYKLIYRINGKYIHPPSTMLHSNMAVCACYYVLKKLELSPVLYILCRSIFSEFKRAGWWWPFCRRINKTKGSVHKKMIKF